jgi:hypothetical protein
MCRWIAKASRWFASSAVHDFYDEDELRRIYYPEAERLVADATGATRVVVFDHTLRRRVWGAEGPHRRYAAPAGGSRA